MKNYGPAIVILLTIIALSLGSIAAMGGYVFYRVHKSESDSRSYLAESERKEREQDRKDAWNTQVYLKVCEMEKRGATYQEITAYQQIHVDNPPADFEPIK